MFYKFGFYIVSLVVALLLFLAIFEIIDPEHGHNQNWIVITLSTVVLFFHFVVLFIYLFKRTNFAFKTVVVMGWVSAFFTLILAGICQPIKEIALAPGFKVTAIKPTP